MAIGGGSGEDFGWFVGARSEVGEGGGGDVVDAIFFDQPLVAVMEGGEGNIAQLSIGGIDNGLDVGCF